MELIIENENKMSFLAKNIAAICNFNDIITLKGDLGVGKTTFAKYFVEYFTNNADLVTSPTFNLVHIYEENSFSIWHFDLYRLKNKEEVFELGIEDAFNHALSIIEWPEIIEDLIPPERLEISFEFINKNENCRKIKLNFSQNWNDKINQLLLIKE